MSDETIAHMVLYQCNFRVPLQLQISFGLGPGSSEYFRVGSDLVSPFTTLDE